MANTTDDNFPNTPESPSDFDCGVCGNSYPNSWELLIHQEMHTEEKLTLAYQCQECGTRFALERQLNRHVLSHSEELKPFKCEDCPSRFRLREHLDVHTRKHNAERPYACHICGFRYEQKTHLVSHMKSHTDDRPYVCDICQSAFKRSYDMKVHRTTHTQEKPFHCDVCGSDFKKLAYLTKHKKTHTTERFVCHQCAAVFKEKRALVGHIRLHNREKSKSFACHVCQENFATSKQLQTHVKSHHPPTSQQSPAVTAITVGHSQKRAEETKQYHCYQCGCSFGSNNAYQLHRSLQHDDGDTPFRCQFCRAAFTRDTYLTVHTLKHVEKKMFCDRCKTYCDSEYEMGQHEWQHVVDQREHVVASRVNRRDNNKMIIIRQPGDGNESSSCSNSSGTARDYPEPYARTLPSPSPSAAAAAATFGEQQGQSRYNCEHCGCLFNLLKPLQLHKKLQHEGQTPFECHWCTAAFTEENFLKVHIYKHLEKRVTCPRCKILCRSEYELAIHECPHSETTERLRYHCATCACSFASHNPYLLHKTLQHEGETPYQCRFCQAAFTREKFLNVHLYKHAAKSATCAKCSTVCASEYEMGLHEWHHVVLDRLNTTVQPTPRPNPAFNHHQHHQHQHRDNGAITVAQLDEQTGERKPPISLPLLVNQELSITVVYTNDHDQEEEEEREQTSPGGGGGGGGGTSRGSPAKNDGQTSYYSYYSEEGQTDNLEGVLSGYREELSKTTKRFHCDDCGCSFGFPKPYQLHVSLQHEGDTPFSCRWCSARFTKDIFLNVHVYKHLRKETTCRVCRAVCHSEYEMGLHEWEHDLDLAEASPFSPPNNCSTSTSSNCTSTNTVLVKPEIEITPVRGPSFSSSSSRPATKTDPKKRTRSKKATASQTPKMARKSTTPKRRGRPVKVEEMVVEPEIAWDQADEDQGSPILPSSPFSQPLQPLKPLQTPEDAPAVENVAFSPPEVAKSWTKPPPPPEEDEIRRGMTPSIETKATYGRGQRNKLKKSPLILSEAKILTRAKIEAEAEAEAEAESESAKTAREETPKSGKRRGRVSKRKSTSEPDPDPTTPITTRVKREEALENPEIIAAPSSAQNDASIKKRGRPAKNRTRKGSEIQKEKPPLRDDAQLQTTTTTTTVCEMVEPGGTPRLKKARPVVTNGEIVSAPSASGAPAPGSSTPSPRCATLRRSARHRKDAVTNYA